MSDSKTASSNPPNTLSYPGYVQRYDLPAAGNKKTVRKTHTVCNNRRYKLRIIRFADQAGTSIPVSPDLF